MDLLVAVANDKERRILEGSFKYDKNIDKLTVLKNGDEVVEYLKANGCDVLVLDMLMPVIDGLSILEEISQLNKHIKIIILSSAKTDAVIKKAFELGADYVMVKPYDINALRRRIYDMNSLGELTNKNIERAIDENYVEKQISSILNGTGIFPNLKGYRYLKCALLYGYKDSEMLEGVTKVLYPRIARENKTTSDRVERAIRHAIESAWGKCRDNELYEKMGFSAFGNKRRPTNSEYIFTAIEYLKMK